MRRTALIPLISAVLALPLSTQAAEPDASVAKEKHLEARLLTDRDAIAPGAELRVGVLFKMDPHWHIYWKNPGSTGLPTKASFKAPEGYQVGELRYPAPIYFEATKAIFGFGYEDEVLLFARVKVPASAVEGDNVKLTAKTSWLVCEKACIRGKASLELTLPVSGELGSKPGQHQALFDRYQARVPGPPPEGLVIEPQLSVNGVHPKGLWEAAISISDKGGAALSDLDYFPDPASGLEVLHREVLTEGEHVPPKGALVRLAGRASDDASETGDRVASVLVLKRDGKPLYIAGTLSVPRLAEGEKTTRTALPIFGPVRAVEPPQSDDAEETEAAPEGEPQREEQSLILMLLFAFLGGLILNAMPCVLPVLSLKVLSLVEQSNETPDRIRRHGYAYTGGILLSFVGLSIPAMVAGQTQGAQLQSPLFGAILAAVMFALALNLFGVFEIGALGAGKMNEAVAKRHGYSQSFVFGIFAVLLATPCSAPFLGTAWGWALTQPPLVTFVVFQAIGFGLAFPFLLIALIPAWAKLLPKPGAWMQTFKTIMGFLLIGGMIWLLLDSLVNQVSHDAFIEFLAFLTVVGVGAWVYGHWGNPLRTKGVRIAGVLSALALIGLGGVLFLGLEPPKARTATAANTVDERPALIKDDIDWRDFREINVEAQADAGRTVFIDFTAKWCMTCKFVEKTVIDTEEVRTVLADLNVLPVKADFTNEDPEIDKWIKRFKRSGVPMYVILPAGRAKQPILLPELPSASEIIDGLKRAEAKS